MYFRRKTQEMCEKHFHRDQILNNWIFKLNNWIFKWNVKYVTWDIQCVKIGSQFVESTKYFLCIFYYFLRFYNAFNLFSDVPSKRCSLVFYLDLIEGCGSSALDPLFIKFNHQHCIHHTKGCVHFFLILKVPEQGFEP